MVHPSAAYISNMAPWPGLDTGLINARHDIHMCILGGMDHEGSTISESESGRNPNPNPAEIRNLVGDLRMARIDPSRGGGIKETRVDLF